MHRTVDRTGTSYGRRNRRGVTGVSLASNPHRREQRPLHSLCGLFCCFRGSLTSPNATSTPLPQRFRHVRRPKLLVDRRVAVGTALAGGPLSVMWLIAMRLGFNEMASISHM